MSELAVQNYCPINYSKILVLRKALKSISNKDQTYFVRFDTKYCLSVDRLSTTLQF